MFEIAFEIAFEIGLYIQSLYNKHEEHEFGYRHFADLANPYWHQTQHSLILEGDSASSMRTPFGRWHILGHRCTTGKIDKSVFKQLKSDLGLVLLRERGSIIYCNEALWGITKFKDYVLPGPMIEESKIYSYEDAKQIMKRFVAEQVGFKPILVKSNPYGEFQEDSLYKTIMTFCVKYHKQNEI